MESPSEVTGAKRKRSPENPTPGAHQIQAPVRDVTQINYLVRARTERLKLIEGDSETFVDVLGMIDDYEGVLQRHESLAANLGAKLVGPLLLKSFEKLFDGPIKIIQQSFGLEQSSVSWLDVVAFARSNPLEFMLSDSMHGGKCCRFWIKGGQVEITEDDYRLILSGGPERMIPSQPIAEDETAELGTLNILESRLAMLIKKADAVASKARQLNYHLKGRKTAVLARKAPDQVSDSGSETRTFSPQPFSAINSVRSPGTVNNEAAAKLQQDLLDQFLAVERRPPAPQPRPKNIRLSHIEGFHTFPNVVAEPEQRRVSSIDSTEEGTEGHHRMLMAGRIEKLSRGDVIDPPCDRCRRLRFECTKHLTACSACTKKHAKCRWRDMKKSEFEQLQSSAPQGNTGGENGSQNTESEREPISAGGAPVRPRDHPRELTDEEFRAALQGAPQSDRRLESMSHERIMLSRIASAAAAAAEHRER